VKARKSEQTNYIRGIEPNRNIEIPPHIHVATHVESSRCAPDGMGADGVC
jgi:hypothetical protein